MRSMAPSFVRLCLSLLAIVCVLPVRAQQNLLTNPGFETGAFLPGWVISTAQHNTLTLTHVAAADCCRLYSRCCSLALFVCTLSLSPRRFVCVVSPGCQTLIGTSATFVYHGVVRSGQSAYTQCRACCALPSLLLLLLCMCSHIICMAHSCRLLISDIPRSYFFHLL